MTVDRAAHRLRNAYAAEDWSAVAAWLPIVDELDERERDRLASVTLASAALWYAGLGLRVFPLQPLAKLPFRRSRGCHDATTDHDRITSWWRAAPDANVAIATGHVVDVIDVDGHEGVCSYARIDRLPPALGMVSTPRPGGLHRYIASDGQRGNRARLAAGVDYRGRGGYVVAPPSRTEQGAYRWLAPLRLTKEGNP